MNVEKTWLWGGAGGVVGLLIGLAIGGDGREAREATLRAQDEMAKSVAALNDSVGRIGQTVADLDGKVMGIGTAMTEVSEQQAGLQGLSARIDQVGTEIDSAMSQIGGAVSDVGSQVTASLGERMEGLRSALAGIGARAGGGGKAGDEEAGDETAGGEQAGGDQAGGGQAAAAPGEGEAVTIGSAIDLGDGAARLFLSSVDPEAGEARVAINGPVASTVTLGEPAEAGACSVTLTGFTEDGGATFSADCGDGAASAAAGGGTDSAEAPAATGAGTAVAIGAAETLVDGKLRVFLSAIDADGARVAINGPATVSLAIGQPVEVNGCTVTLTGTGEGQATFEGAC